MQYTFEGKKIVDGNRTFLDIPFNVWDITGCTGNIPVKVDADGILFECKLIPKGNGRYYIPVKKAIAGKLNIVAEQAYEIRRLKMENELLRDFLSLTGKE